MKKTLIIFFLMFVISVGYAQNIEYTNQVTVEWDAVAPIEPTDIISYQVWYNSTATGTLMVGETDLLQYTITFIEEGGYIIGVGTKREAGGETVYSEINWSNEDVPPGATPNPFVVVYIKAILAPGNLRIQ